MTEQALFDVDGQEIITSAIMDLVNAFPLLEAGDKIKYSVLSDSKGKAIFPTSGAAVMVNNKDVTGHVYQEVEYPFIVIYRAGALTESRREKVKEWLDNLGRWLERQPIANGASVEQLAEYPKLSGSRAFLYFRRTTAAYMDSINDNQIEQWAINLTARYSNEYDER